MDGWEDKILNVPTITAEQITSSLLAIPAFLPATVCTGYMAAWFTNLHNFRQRSLVERIFWSVPLSLAVSTIASVLIGRFLSLTAVAVFFIASGALWLATLGWEWLRLRRSSRNWTIGWRPLGGTALILAIVWMAVVVLSLVDFQSNHKLLMNFAMADESYRVNWTESVLRTGVPPANPLYWYKQPAAMRNYYFWYVLCAAIAKMAHLPARAVCNAGCVWSGFGLAALIGLYLKYFLAAGVRLRRQFLRSIFLLTVTGLDVCVGLWDIFYLHRAPPFDLEAWSKDGIVSWLHTLFWAPNHIASLVCCMSAFLLAWMAGKDGKRGRPASWVLIAAALASAFGLSIFVAFTFFLVMLFWGLWQVAVERAPRPALLLAAGGGGAAVLLLPYLWELTHTNSKMAGGSVFEFSVREMIPPNGLLASPLFHHLAIAHPLAALNLAKLVLLTPGYVIELGFYLAVFLIYLVPAWRGRIPLTPAQRALLFITAVTFPIMSLVRSGVLKTNDFGWRAALFVQFPLLLLGSEVITGWKVAEGKRGDPAESAGLPYNTPQWLRSIAAVALIVGVISTLTQALLLRFVVPLAESQISAAHNPDSRSISHKHYISSIGYAELDASIPHDAIVQFNTGRPEPLWTAVDLLGINHQIAMAGDKEGCGSELGGDPSGCPAMAAAIDPLFNGPATATQARTVCHEYNIQYLVARVYDPAWKDKSGWVWTLRPVVSDEEFRALDCR